jgi:hypothetical protein
LSPGPGGRPTNVYEIAFTNLSRRKDRILNVHRLINLSSLLKVLAEMVRPVDAEFEKLEREHSTVEITGNRIVKVFTAHDKQERLNHLRRVYDFLKSKEVLTIHTQAKSVSTLMG